MISLLEDDTDHEAICALNDLLRAEELKVSTPGLLARVQTEIDKKIDLLTKIRMELPDTIDTGDPSEGERRVEDFFERIADSEREEERKTYEDPADRRNKREAKQKRKFWR